MNCKQTAASWMDASTGVLIGPHHKRNNRNEARRQLLARMRFKCATGQVNASAAAVEFHFLNCPENLIRSILLFRKRTNL